MPMYEWRCPECGDEREVLHRHSEVTGLVLLEKQYCDRHVDERGHRRLVAMHRVLSPFNAHFKGEGWKPRGGGMNLRIWGRFVCRVKGHELEQKPMWDEKVEVLQPTGQVIPMRRKGWRCRRCERMVYHYSDR